ncbi:hypothetical protein [Burkholderia gladioli]|uniref:hypothetical protein n=1 Tax=Burkholderia gladioli TaxID=28095 RepID=UPI001641EC70|nr:hypothetical protein [Burkholderia gladioli]
MSDKLSDVRAFPSPTATSRAAPKRIMRPCEYGLWGAVKDMETQMGTVEAYNRLCDWAEHLKAKIDRGDAQAQNRLFATDPKMIYPAGDTR